MHDHPVVIVEGKIDRDVAATMGAAIARTGAAIPVWMTLVWMTAWRIGKSRQAGRYTGQGNGNAKTQYKQTGWNQTGMMAGHEISPA
ncbi:hypothetical protein [Ferrovibrio sp.]|uniref:hypothetical protein n=1 Tax=Ferrovibrio sp. TaxID=1917215 RepID=UPI0035AEF9DB